VPEKTHLGEAIRDRFNGPGASARLEDFVQAGDIATTFWSRTGD
jgi:hypothetical protein